MSGLSWRTQVRLRPPSPHTVSLRLTLVLKYLALSHSNGVRARNLLSLGAQIGGRFLQPTLTVRRFEGSMLRQRLDSIFHE